MAAEVVAMGAPETEAEGFRRVTWEIHAEHGDSRASRSRTT